MKAISIVIHIQNSCGARLLGKRKTIILLLLLMSGIAVIGQKTHNDLDNYFSKLAENRAFNGNVLIAEKGKIIYERSFGYADYSTKKPNTQRTSFPVASVTKTITATAIFQLQEKGRLQISDRYVSYFPEFPYPTVTIKQLLSHTSRLPSSAFYGFLDSMRKVKDTIFINKDVISALVAMNKPLTGEPKPAGDRSSFAYSNLNYYLLALLIEKLSGLPYSSYIEKNIFLPAGMRSSGFTEFYFGTDKNIGTEQRYRYLFADAPERIDTTSENAYIFKTFNFRGHGDITSTARDLLKYDHALRSGLLLRPGTLIQAYTPVVPGDPSASGYGLGWSIMHDSTKGKIVLHHGGGLGIEVMFVRNLARDQTVILFDNMKNPAFNTAMNALKILNGGKVQVKKSAAKAYGRVLMKEGIIAARKQLAGMVKDRLNYNLNEDEMNLLGYQLLWNNQLPQSEEVLKTNVELFPDSWNSYDSYGEILLKLGRKDEAINMYKRSVEMNPKNEGGRKVLEEIAPASSDTLRATYNYPDIISEESMQRAQISKRDSILLVNQNIRKDYRIFGYERPDTSSSRLILFSVFTRDVQNNPYRCTYGAYYSSPAIKEKEIKFIGHAGAFVKTALIIQGKIVCELYFEKRWVEFVD
ncbi:MAG: serine hydrolase [Chitinophagaceae bacterium]